MTDTATVSMEVLPGLQVGDVVASKFRVDRVIGRGGMGVVVAARHLELDETVALKFLAPEAVANPEAAARFDREARAASRIKSEYVARVYDAGKLVDGTRYMVLEYLDGEDLAARVARVGPLPVESAVRLLLQAMVAIAEAHGLGIIHRDLKPANLFVVRRPDGVEMVKVLDFGISKSAGSMRRAAELSMTQTGAMMGTPLYASPEQMQSAADVDQRTDIWALGTTLYELLSGSPPFRGDTFAEVVSRVVAANPPSLQQARAGVPPALEQVVLRCLHKDRSGRYESIADLAVALGEAVELDPEAQALVERVVRQHRASLNPGSLAASVAPDFQGADRPMNAAVTDAVMSASRHASVARPRRALVIVSLAVGVPAAVAVGLVVLSGAGTATPATDSAEGDAAPVNPSVLPRHAAAEQPQVEPLASSAQSATPSPIDSARSAALDPGAWHTIHQQPTAGLASATPQAKAAAARTSKRARTRVKPPATAAPSRPTKSPLDVGLK